ncbi:hypothetical protein RND71_008695 [Anisodus tanguticus]|uniref:Uncharacterized protein n=1 Tax=Anisodus tanguticus TaxID=243964 RepID=A0AAE1SRD5_9SOLA|nr:hypothetical protein RND71_008695 [Anisodus tanguticus]
MQLEKCLGRISPPVPKNFLIFNLLDELPKGDYVLEELAESLEKVDAGHPCSASSILRSLNISLMPVPTKVAKDIDDNNRLPVQTDSVSSLGDAIDQAREEAKEIEKAKAAVRELQGEGMRNSVQVLMGLIKPLGRLVPYVQEVLAWERPRVDWQRDSSSLIGNSCYDDMGKKKRWLQHADLVMVGMVGAAVILAVVPFKFILMALTLCPFVKTSKIGKYMENEKVNSRIKEWYLSSLSNLRKRWLIHNIGGSHSRGIYLFPLM